MVDKMNLLIIALALLLTECIGQKPDQTQEKMKIGILFQPDKLNILIENGGVDTIKIWKFNNSWGWSTLSLVFKRTDTGEEFRLVKRKATIWTKNGPGFYKILPGEKLEVPIYPGGKAWEPNEKLSVIKNQSFRLKAILEIPETEKARDLGIFIGKIESEWIESQPPHSWLFPDK